MREVGSDQFIYREVRDWGEFPSGWIFEDTPGVAVDSQDCVYAFTREKNGIVVFNPDGSLLKTWGDDLFKRPHCIFIGPDDTIFCVDDFGHAVYRFTSDGEQLMVIETANNPADTGYIWGDRPSDIVRSGPPFNFPTWVALSPEGELYVTDGYGNARVHKFSPEGQLLFSWGEPGAGIGQFETPHSVHVDKDGWVCNSWTLNTTTGQWSPPIARPTLTTSQDAANQIYEWDESLYEEDTGSPKTLGWVLLSL